MMALISSIDGSMSAFEPKQDILNIHRDIISQNIINCNKLS